MTILEKISNLVFSILCTISMLSAISIFIAGSLILVFIQLFQFILYWENIWLALLIVVPLAILTVCVSLKLIQNMFFKIFDTEQQHYGRSSIVEFLITFSVYEFIKFLGRRSQINSSQD